MGLFKTSLGKSSFSIRFVSSADRHFGRSPPKVAPIQNPELKRLSTASQDDPPLPPPTKYQIGRCGSTANIRLTGSGHSGKSIRLPTTETIPERADDVEESPSASTVRERIRKSTTAAADKPPRDKESSKRGSRRDSRSTPVDANIMNRHDYHPAPSPHPPPSLRSAPVNDDAIRNVCQLILCRRSVLSPSGKTLRSYLHSEPSYHSHEAQQQHPPRDLSPPSVVRPSPAPPPPPRSSPYVDERDFVGLSPPLGRPPASPFGGDRD